MSGVVSFEGKGLKLDDATSVTTIVSEIDKHVCIDTICFSGNSIGVAAAEAIGNVLKTKSQLKNLLLADIFTARTRAEIPKSMEYISNGIKESGCKLEIIDISDNAFGYDGIKACKILFNPETCSNLKVLKLNNNGLGSMGGQVLASFLEEIYAKNNQLTIETVVCGRNRLEKEGAFYLSNVIKNMSKLKEFHIPQNGIVWQGIEHLSKSLACCPDIEVINFNDNTFTVHGGLAFAECLKSLPKIKTIDIGDCLVRSEGMQKIFRIIECYNPLLTSLNLSFNELKLSDALMIVDICSKLSHLTYLDINGNSFTTECIEKIENKSIFYKLKSLQQINPDDCEVSSSYSDEDGTDSDNDSETSGKEKDSANDSFPSKIHNNQDQIDSILNNLKI